MSDERLSIHVDKTEEERRGNQYVSQRQEEGGKGAKSNERRVSSHKDMEEKMRHIKFPN